MAHWFTEQQSFIMLQADGFDICAGMPRPNLGSSRPLEPEKHNSIPETHLEPWRSRLAQEGISHERKVPIRFECLLQRLSCCVFFGDCHDGNNLPRTAQADKTEMQRRPQQ